MFRKGIKEKLFQKKYLKYLEQKADRAFFESCFTLKDGVYVFSAEATKENTKKVKALVKAIKSNRKLPVRLLPLLAAAVVAAGGFFFFTLFMNPILENLMEKGLENLFEARVTVDKFHLSLIRFTVGIERLTIADRDNPWTNLIELGRTGITLNPRAVLRGKIDIEEIRADNLQFGGERSVSGALPAKPAKVKPEKPKREMPPLIDLAQFDAQALLNRELDKLQSLKLYDEAEAFYEETVAKWKGRVDDAQKQLAEIEAAAQPFITFNVNSIDIRDPATIERARQLITDGQRAIAAVQSSVEMANVITAGLDEDIRAAKQLEEKARAAVSGDFAHLRSYVDLQSGAYREILEPLIGDILTAKAEEYIRYGQRALEVLEQIRAIQARIPKTEKKKSLSFRGRTVNFPSRQYPFFHLGLLASNFSLDDWEWAFELREISSEPDLSDLPATLSLTLQENAAYMRNAAVFASADLRSGASELFHAVLVGSNFPVELADVLSGIGIGAYRGSAGFSVESSGLTDGSFSAAGNVGLSNNVIRDPEGTIAGAVADAVSRAGSIDLGIIYNHPAEGSDSFTVNTNIGNLIMDALSRAARAYAQKAVEDLEKSLRGYINSYIQGKIAPEELDDLFALAKGDKAALDRLQANLQGRLADVEARVRGRVDGVIDDAKQRAAELEAEARQKAADAEAEARRKAEAAEAEVRRQAEDARKQAEAAQAEALRRAEETRRQAEEEARRRAEAAEAEIRRQAEEARKQAEEEARRQAQDALRGRLPF